MRPYSGSGATVRRSRLPSDFEQAVDDIMAALPSVPLEAVAFAAHRVHARQKMDALRHRNCRTGRHPDLVMVELLARLRQWAQEFIHARFRVQ